MQIKFKTTNSIILLVIAYILLVAPLALNFNFYYPDEIHYTDAAIKMVHDGDILTPYTGSGTLRFKKPILTYWFVLLGFKLFGISSFAARFFFLIASGATLLFIFRTAKLIYNDKQTALIAAAITASNITFLMSSMRSIPDILLCLFISMIFLGFAGFIKFGNNTPIKYNWILFLGLALAIEVKGIPAIIPTAVGLLYLLINPWQRIKLLKILRPIPILVSLIIAASWFVWMYKLHGDQFFQSFFNDQVGKRVSFFLWVVLKNIGLSIALIAGLLLPWITFLSRKKLGQQTIEKEYKAFHLFVIVILLSLLLSAGLVFKFYDRYLLPMVPFWSVFIAHLISTKLSDQTNKIKTWGIILLVIHAIVLLAALYLIIPSDESFIMYFWIAGAAGITYFIFHRLFHTRNIIWLAITIPLLAFNLAIITNYVSLPHEGQQLAQILKANNIDEDTPIGFIGNHEKASKLRISSRGKYNIVNHWNYNPEENSEKYKILVISSQKLQSLPENSFQIIDYSAAWGSSKDQSLMLSLLTGNYKEQLKISGEKYYVVKLKQLN